jgi:hypothetical protein
MNGTPVPLWSQGRGSQLSPRLRWWAMVATFAMFLALLCALGAGCSGPSTERPHVAPPTLWASARWGTCAGVEGTYSTHAVSAHACYRPLAADGGVSDAHE